MGKVSSVFIERAIERSIIRSADRSRAIDLASDIDLEHQHALFDAWHVILFIGWLVANMGALVLLFEAKDSSDDLAWMVATLLSGLSIVVMTMAKRASMRFAAALASIAAVSYVFFASVFASNALDFDSDTAQLFSGALLIAASIIFIAVNGFPALVLFSWGGSMIVAEVLIDPTDVEVFLLHSGWVTLVVSYALNLVGSRNYTFWLNKVGLLVLAVGMKDFVDPGVFIEIEYLLISMTMIVVAVVVGYPSYAFSGVLGLATYIIFLIDIVYRDDRLTLGVALFGLGAVICYCAVSWRKLVDFFNLGGKLKPKELPTPYMFGVE